MRTLYDKLFSSLRKVKLFDKILSLPLIAKLVEYEVLMYLIFGVLTTVVNFVVFWLCGKITDADKALLTLGGFTLKWVYLANAIAWVSSVIFAFVTNKLFVFESKAKDSGSVMRELVSFFGARILSFVLFDVLMFALLYDVLHLNEYLVKVINSVFVVIFNYVASKLVVFRNKEKTSK
ncbi:MAG: GtrA family protein [Clostridia bacterium]|nr:GtrA family protein [Clostridia bacterium]